MDPTVMLVLFVLLLAVTWGLLVFHLTVLVVGAATRVVRRTRSPSDRGFVEHRSAAGTASPTVGYLIAAYNEEASIGPCIESVLRQEIPPQAIVVVDDGSTDRTSAVASEYRSQGVTVITLPSNRGRTYALEAGLPHLSTDLVAITDADSLTHPQYIREVLASFRDPEIAAVGGIVESIPQTWITAARQTEYMLTMLVGRRAQTQLGTIPVLSGAATTYRRSVLVDLGFDHDTLAEDMDLTFRLRKTGRRFLMNMNAKVYTADPPTLRAYFHQVLRWYTELGICLRKHRDVFGTGLFGWVELPFIVATTVFGALAQIGLTVGLFFLSPPLFVIFLSLGIAMDLAIATIAWRVHRRRDVFWAILSRPPTRLLVHVGSLLALSRVFLGRPDRRWRSSARPEARAFLHRMTQSNAGAPLAQPNQKTTDAPGPNLTPWTVISPDPP
ncbi:MAG: glycosyltransferase family 2 protein [Thermoplasmatota archaeon]